MKIHAVLILACSLLASVASGDEKSDAAARAHFESGQHLSSEGRHIEALAEFSAGYELTHRPIFLYNMAESARAASRLTRARELYTRYLAEDPNGRLAASARARLDELGGPPAQAPTPAPVAAPTPATSLSASVPPLAAPQKPPLWKRPALWISIGAVIVVGSIAGGVGGYYATRGCSSCVDFRN